MKRLILITLLLQTAWSQEDTTSVLSLNEPTDSVEVDSLDQSSALIADTQQAAVLDPSIPLTLDVGYKGFLWGSPANMGIVTNFAQIDLDDSLSLNKSYVGKLGPDSAMVHYFFADSGFWKVEIDFHIETHRVEKHIQDFLRHEKIFLRFMALPQKLTIKNLVYLAPTQTYLTKNFLMHFIDLPGRLILPL